MKQKQQSIGSSQAQKMKEIQFTVMKDLMNVMGIYYETAMTLEYFKDQPNHPMTVVGTNRFVTMVNLSNCINFDQYSTYQDDKKCLEHLNSLKEEAQKFAKQLKSQVAIHDKIDHIMDHYLEKNLAKNVILNQLNVEKTELGDNRFSQGVVQTIINSMSSTDEEYRKLKSNDQLEQLPLVEDMQEELMRRKKRAHKLLQQNFPQIIQNKQQQQQKYNQQTLEQNQTQVKLSKSRLWKKFKVLCSRIYKKILYIVFLAIRCVCVEYINSIIQGAKSRLFLTDRLLNTLKEQLTKKANLSKVVGCIINSLKMINKQIQRLLGNVIRIVIQRSQNSSQQKQKEQTKFDN